MDSVDTTDTVEAADAADGTPLRVAVIIGSTRRGRVGGRIGRWVAARVERRRGLAVDLLDLVEFAFPDRHPTRPTPQISRFTQAIDRADAFVVVTPEYNRSFPASLKQAIDYAYEEWRAKPVGFVSYGCASPGLFAVEALRPVFAELHTVTVRDGVCLDLLDSAVGEDGTPLDAPDSRLERAAAAMLDELAWWGLALREARIRRPYTA